MWKLWAWREVAFLPAPFLLWGGQACLQRAGRGGQPRFEAQQAKWGLGPRVPGPGRKGR